MTQRKPGSLTRLQIIGYFLAFAVFITAWFWSVMMLTEGRYGWAAGLFGVGLLIFAPMMFSLIAGASKQIKEENRRLEVALVGLGIAPDRAVEARETLQGLLRR